MEVATGVMGDDTGCFNFRLRNEHVEHIKKGATVCLRNYKCNVIDEHILLELDRFGKVTVESGHDIKPNNENNISDQSWELKDQKKWVKLNFNRNF